MGYGNFKSDREDDDDLYDRDAFTGSLRYEGFSWREAEDIADDWGRQKDK